PGARLQPQPLAHQRRTPLGRVPAIAGGLPRRAHRVVVVVVVAGAVAVAVHRRAVLGPGARIDLAVVLAAHGDLVDPQQRSAGDIGGGGDLAGVELVVRVERLL